MKTAFKIGDWVRIKTPIFEYDGTDRIAEGIKKLSIKDMWIFDENHFKMNPDRYIVHWKPKEGEWCWFWDIGCTTPILDKFVFKHENVCPYFTKTTWFDNIEPFIGELPSFLKDK